MPNTPFVKSSIESRYIGRDHNAADESALSEAPRPLSLSMGPTLIWLNAVGNAEAIQITESWRPRFTIRAATNGETEAWL